MKTSTSRKMLGFLTCLLGGTAVIGLVIHSASAANPVQYRIDHIESGSTWAHCSECSKIIFQPTDPIQIPAVIIDYDDGTQKARLTRMVINASDSYEIIPDPENKLQCRLNSSKLVITLNETCLNFSTGGVVICNYSRNDASVVIQQTLLDCHGKSCARTLTVRGGFLYDRCANKGYLEFDLPAYYGPSVDCARSIVKYHIGLIGIKLPSPAPKSTDWPCGGATPIPSPTPTAQPTAS